MIVHGFPFDPAYGYDEAGLRAIRPPPVPTGFADFWHATRTDTDAVPLRLERLTSTHEHRTHRVSEVRFTTLGGHRVGAWLLEPLSGAIERGLVVGHGYGGRSAPEVAFLPSHTVALLPCAPGFDLSAHPDLPAVADRHVVHGIAARESYLIRACVASLWSAASALLDLHPGVAGRLAYHGSSFGGGLGALALPWDDRYGDAFLEVPTFGHHPLRLQCPGIGSGEAVRRWRATHPEVVEVLRFYDAASAATLIERPVLCAPALFDPAVPPPGQWAVANALPQGEILPLTAGHYDNPHGNREQRRLREALKRRF